MAKGKKSRRLKNKEEDHEQKHCTSCNRPINQNNFDSSKMVGLCGSCFRRDLKENQRRKISKKISINKNKERKIKSYLQEY
jgi:hypothetical protein